MISPSFAEDGCLSKDHDVVCIFTDGSIGKGNSSGTAVIGLLDRTDYDFPRLKDIEVYSKYYDESTNNIAELSGILFGIKKALEKYKCSDNHTYTFLLFSDSEYSIKSLTEWIFAWYKTYTYEKVNGIVVPSMFTKGGTPVKNAQFICAIIHYIVEHEKDFLDFCFINVKGHKNFKDMKDIKEQMSYYEKVNKCTITTGEAVFITRYNNIADRVAYNVVKYINENGYTINFDDNGEPCMVFNYKGLNFKVYDSVNDDLEDSNYYILTKQIMKRYRMILEHLPF